jgi:hypothetical protein
LGVGFDQQYVFRTCKGLTLTSCSRVG